MTRISLAHQWETAEHEAPEVSCTSGLLKIAAGDSIFTRNEDDWSKTVRDEVRVAAYPLALWLATSWWRLRWEPLPYRTPDNDWRMAHEIAAAAYGFVWPQL